VDWELLAVIVAGAISMGGGFLAAKEQRAKGLNIERRYHMRPRYWLMLSALPAYIAVRELARLIIDGAEVAIIIVVLMGFVAGWCWVFAYRHYRSLGYF
jgi:hypothetical protein